MIEEAHSFEDSVSTSESPSSPSLPKSKPIRKKREKYMKISAKQRDQLLEGVFFQNKKVKKAAAELNINYSSAKTILFLHRKKVKAFLIRKNHSEETSQDNKRCLFKIVPQAFIHNKVQIVTMHGGKQMFEKTAVFHGNIQTKTNQSAFSLVKKGDKTNNSEEYSHGIKLSEKQIDTLKKTFLLLLSIALQPKSNE